MRTKGVIFARIDTVILSHRRAIQAGPEAMGLWVYCVTWSRHEQHNGFIPVDVLRAAWGGKSNLRLAQKLVAAGLLLPEPGGFRVFMYAEKNETKEEIEHRRTAWADKQKSRRIGASEQNVSRDKGETTRGQGRDNAGTDPVCLAVVSQMSPLPLATETETETETETDLRDQRILSEFETPTTPTHTEGGGQSREIAQDAPGTPTEAPIDPAPVPEVKASQEPSQAPALTALEPGPRGKRARAPTGKHALPPDWNPSPACDAFLRAKYHPADIASAIEDMTDWAKSNTARKADWDATLRGWLKRDFLAGKVRPAPPRPALFDQPTPTKPAATDEELAAFFADNAPETFAPGSDLYDETEEAS